MKDTYRKLVEDAARVRCQIFYVIDMGSMRCSENKCIPCRARALVRASKRKHPAPSQEKKR